MRHSPLIEFRTTALESDGTFMGYASVFDGRPDSYGDVVLAGAFADTLSQHAAAGTSPAMLWAHDPASPIGAWKALTEDEHGLRAHGKLTLAVPRAREALALLKDGGISGLSVGFVVPPDGARREGGTRVLSQLDLHEISLTPLPARANARVMEVRSFTDPRELERELEHRIRQAGILSKIDARRAARFATAGLIPPKHDPAEIEKTLAAIRAATNRIKGV